MPAWNCLAGAVAADRTATIEGRIRREMGLCIGCARCVRVCGHAPEAGGALEMGAPENRARPKKETLRASGCTFCGLCVMVCPTGALTAPGEAGARWLAGRKEKNPLPPGILPPETRQAFTRDNVAVVSAVRPACSASSTRGGRVVFIRGVEDLRAGLTAAADDPACSAAAFFQMELHPLYTQRESELLARHAKEWGRLPPANDLGDDLFDDVRSGGRPNEHDTGPPA